MQQLGPQAAYKYTIMWPLGLLIATSLDAHGRGSFYRPAGWQGQVRITPGIVSASIGVPDRPDRPTTILL